jgi:hypothetical protein
VAQGIVDQLKSVDITGNYIFKHPVCEIPAFLIRPFPDKGVYKLDEDIPDLVIIESLNDGWYQGHLDVGLTQVFHGLAYNSALYLQFLNDSIVFLMDHLSIELPKLFQHVLIFFLAQIRPGGWEKGFVFLFKM